MLLTVIAVPGCTVPLLYQIKCSCANILGEREGANEPSPGRIAARRHQVLWSLPCLSSDFHAPFARGRPESPAPCNQQMSPITRHHK